MPAPQMPSSAPGLNPPVVLTDKLEKPTQDNRQYRVICLGNKLEALVVHDPDTDKASAALDVHVGSFSDEDDMPGMAHAVEHLLFMGTKKFPGENDYSQYLSANSGSSNAYTASTSTNYFFDVAAKPSNDEEPTEQNPSPLYGALDRFAQFFIEPLFLASTLDRELQAVDSENKKNLQNDGWRLVQLDKSLSSPNHPFHHFSTGSLDTLKVKPEARGVNIREKFIEFHAKHYSANRMKLVVLGREPLDLLQKWVEEFFSGVVNKNLPQNVWNETSPYRPEDLGTQWFAKPVMDMRQLDFTFPFIDEEPLYESQPSRYLGHLIGHEGPGSIMSYIKSKGWAYSLSAGMYPICPGTAGHFEIQIRLTEEGLNKYTEIVKAVFQYISLLNDAPPQEWIFEEQKEMSDVDFKFKQKSPAERFTSRTANSMQGPMPREWLLSNGSVLRKFDPEMIKTGLKTLRPDNMRLGIVSRTYPGNWDKTEKWYGTEYRFEKIEPSLMKEFEQAAALSPEERIPELHLPHKNEFIPNQLDVEKKDIAKTALAPRLLRHDLKARTWWKKDDTFWVPRANVVALLKNPIVHANAENAVKARLFAALVRDALEEYSYDAELAGLQYGVTVDNRGLLLEVSGYNDKLALLLKHVATTMRDMEIKEDRFEIVRERLTRSYYNKQFEAPYLQFRSYFSWLMSEKAYPLEELSEELPIATVESVRQFQKQLLSQMHIEVLCLGNLHKADAHQLTEEIEMTFQARPLPRDQWPIIRSLVLPSGSNYVFNKTLKDPANVNNCVVAWSSMGDRGDPIARAKALLMGQIGQEPGFDQLRTKEQLGYVVFSGYRPHLTSVGHWVLVQSERTCDYLDGRIEAFLVKLGEILDNMTDKQFEDQKRSLVVSLLEKWQNMPEEFNSHWGQISGEYYDFGRARIDAANVKALSKAEMQEVYHKFVSPASSQRARLSIHLHAQDAGEFDKKIIKLLVDAGLSDVPTESRQNLDLLEKYLSEKSSVGKEKPDSILAQAKELGLERVAPEDRVGGPNGVSAIAMQDIPDVLSFKASLMISPGARPVRDLSEYEELDAKL